MLTFHNLRKIVSVFGLALIFLLNSCATAPKLNQPKLSKQLLENRTKPILGAAIEIFPHKIRTQMDQFRIALNKGKLTPNDWKIHDELLDYYIGLKNTSGTKLNIPPYSRVKIPIETYCLNAGRAVPTTQEVFHWQKDKPGIKYFSELLALRRNGEVTQGDLQAILWNLGNETNWDDYPERLKAILQKIDPRVAMMLPSRLKDQARSLITNSLFNLPGVSDALDTYNFVKGKYYPYEEFRQSIERLSSKHQLSDYNELPQIPGTEVFSQSRSEGFSNQTITFYNPSNIPQEVDLTQYFLSPERKDVQRIGINPVNADSSLLKDLEKLLFEDLLQLGIGFTPILGDVADIYETIYGKDFLTGETLSSDERLAAGIGITIGSGSAFRHAKRWMSAPEEYLPKFETALANMVNKTLGRPACGEAKRTLDYGKTAGTSLTEGLDFRGTQELSNFLRDNNIERKFRVQTVKSFEPGSIERRVVRDDETVYRWHNGDRNVQKFGRYVSPEKIQDKKMARERLALPSENRQLYFDSFLLKKDTVVFEGRVAPYVGQPGGGRQILITGDLQKALTIKEGIK